MSGHGVLPHQCEDLGLIPSTGLRGSVLLCPGLGDRSKRIQAKPQVPVRDPALTNTMGVEMA